MRKLGVVITATFTTRNTSGVLTNADSLPTCVVLKNKTADALAVTVTNYATGLYSAQFTPTVAASFASGDTVEVVETDIVAGFTDSKVIFNDVMYTNNIDDVKTDTAAVKLKTDVLTFHGSYIKSDVIEVNDIAVTLLTDSDHKILVAKALKDTDVSTTAAVSGSIYKDTNDNIDAVDTSVAGVSTKIGTPVALDGGTASIASNLVKLADDSGGSLYDATSDSAHTKTATLVDNNATKVIIAKALKDQDVSLVSSASGSVHDDIMDNIDAVDTSVGGVSSQVTTVDGKVDTAILDIGTAISNIGAVDGKVDTAISDIGTVDGKVDTVILNVATVDGKVDTVVSAVGTVDGKVDTVISDIVTVDGKVDTVILGVGTIEGKADTIISDIGGLNDISTSDVKTQADTALTDLNLDKLIKNAGADTDVTDNSLIAKIVSKAATADFTSYSNVTDSLEALADKTSGLTAQETANAVSNLAPVGAAAAGSVKDRLVAIAVVEGTPVALDGGTATISGMLVKMVDDTTGTTYNAELDSLHTKKGGLTAQETANAMLLAPVGSTVAGSVHAKLNSIIGLSGSNLVTISVVDGFSAPIPDVTVEIWNSSLTTYLTEFTTGVSGAVQFTADNGTYKVFLRKLSGVVFDPLPKTLVVSGATTVSYVGSVIVPTPPPSVAYCTLYVYAKGLDGTPSGGTFSVKEIRAPKVKSGVVIMYGGEQDQFDSMGYAELIALRGADVEFLIETPTSSESKRILVPNLATANFGLVASIEFYEGGV